MIIFSSRIIFSILCIFATFVVIPMSAASTIETKDELLIFLKEDGIEPGNIFWQKQQMEIDGRYSYSPGLTKLTFIDADILPIYSASSSKKRIVILVRNEKNDEFSLVINESWNYSTGEYGTALGKLYTTDPKKITAKWGKKILKAISERSLVMGMTSQQVRTSWGNPKKVNSSTGSWGRSEQWIYREFPDEIYLYIQNGKLESWQD